MILGNVITKLIHDKELSDSELNFLFNKIINAEINENLISAILTLITRNGFTYKNIFSAAKILRKKLIIMVRIFLRKFLKVFMQLDIIAL